MCPDHSSPAVGDRYWMEGKSYVGISFWLDANMSGSNKTETIHIRQCCKTINFKSKSLEDWSYVPKVVMDLDKQFTDQNFFFKFLYYHFFLYHFDTTFTLKLQPFESGIIRSVKLFVPLSDPISGRTTSYSETRMIKPGAGVFVFSQFGV